MKSLFLLVLIVALFVEKSVSEKSIVQNLEITTKLKISFEVNGEQAGEILVGLFTNFAPKAAENFKSLCLCNKGVTSKGVKLCYVGTKIYSNIQGFMMVGGDIEKNTGKGDQSISIYGTDNGFDEFNTDYKIPHAGYALAAIGQGEDDNRRLGSRFYIYMGKEDSNLSKTNIVFGRVMKNKELVRYLNSLGQSLGGQLAEGQTTQANITISGCEEVPLHE
eukprot:TRINITY_DN14073_c0_g3_i1.p1 TRINITY_DN14073_c0_g3~~TRINITY_DN14073_c0_g3_i1.p1  ORF type:complete len:220 (-),score=35.88 TRINITY_DN14073_c0_g3_i1:202-861(-)